MDTLQAIVSLMLTENYSEAHVKLICLRQSLTANTELICMYNADYAFSMAPFMPWYQRSCMASCNNAMNCGRENQMRLLKSMTLQVPADVDRNVIEVAIGECINGATEAGLCDHVYDLDVCIRFMICLVFAYRCTIM